MKPVVDGLVRKYAGTYDIRIMNGSSGNPDVEGLSQTFGIAYVPTFVFVNSDGTVSAKIVGAVPASRLEEELARLR
jgi:thioredoxin-like negative regulator of GroEL